VLKRKAKFKKLKNSEIPSAEEMMENCGFPSDEIQRILTREEIERFVRKLERPKRTKKKIIMH
jgi:hypothetical protein